MKNFLQKFSIKEKEMFKKWLDNLINNILSNSSFKEELMKNSSLALNSLDSNITKKFSLKIKKNSDNKTNITLSESTLTIFLPKNDNLNDQVLDRISGGLTTLVELKRGQDGKLYYAEGTVVTDGNLNMELNEQNGAFRLKTSK